MVRADKAESDAIDVSDPIQSTSPSEDQSEFSRIIATNLQLKFKSELNSFFFYASASSSETNPEVWKILSRTDAAALEKTMEPGYAGARRFMHWSDYSGGKPFAKNNYWIVQAEPPLIDGLGDVWSDRMMELYAALFNLSHVLQNRHGMRPHGNGGGLETNRGDSAVGREEPAGTAGELR